MSDVSDAGDYQALEIIGCDVNMKLQLESEQLLNLNELVSV